MTKQRNDLDQQLASVTLQKDALIDEAENLRTEAAEARTQMDRLCSEAATVNKARAELEVRLDRAEKAMVSADERLKALRKERTDQMEIIEELQTQLGNEYHFSISVFTFSLSLNFVQMSLSVKRRNSTRRTPL